MATKVGTQSFSIGKTIHISGSATIVGPKEGKGPLGDLFDTVLEDTYYGEKCWEKTESKILKEAIQHAVEASGKQIQQIEAILSGDLLNQCTASSFAMRDLSPPHIGLYSACATFSEGLLLGAVMIESGALTNCAIATSSHHDSAERQYRFPTELGVQRPPTAQWTVTGAGAVVLEEGPGSPRITGATLGKVIDMGLKDPYDMGSAMAPAAFDTLKAHFTDFQRDPAFYDNIVTGDLGRTGTAMLFELGSREGIDFQHRLFDCGTAIYSEEQDVHSGGSGAAAQSVVFSAYFLDKLRSQKLKVLVVGTGALLSPISYQQGESIPCVAHAVVIEG